MFRRLLVCCVLLGSTAAEAFQLRAIQFPPATVEGDGQVFVAVQLEREPSDVGACDITGNFSVLDSSNPVLPNATGGVDYQPQTFGFAVVLADADGITEDVFAVTVFDEAVLEPDEVFLVQIDNITDLNCPGGQVIQAGPGNVLIVNDDPGNASLSLVPTVLAVDEGAGTAQVRVDLTGEASVQPPFTVTVDFASSEGTATDDDDFTPVSGTLAFNPNQLSQTITVPIQEDALAEGDETFSIGLSNANGDQPGGSPFAVAIAAPTTTVTITDNDTPAQLQFSAATFSADEAAGTLVLTLSRIGNPNGTVTADFATVNGTATGGTDFTAASGTVTWPDGDSADKTVSVVVADDDLAEGDETFTVTLSNPTGGAVLGTQDTATATITDNDVPGSIGFPAVAVSVTEDAGAVTLTVSRGGSTGGVVTVDFATVDGSAIAGNDYTAAAGTITWADGDSADKTVTVALLEDTEDEPDETFSVVLSNVTGPANLGNNGTATVTIGANDTARDIAAIVALNNNQRALATWFDDVCPRLGDLNGLTSEQQDLNDVCGSVKSVALSDSAVRTALDAINPDELMIASFNALRLTAVQHGNLSHRINALRSGASGIDLAGLELEIDGQRIAGNVLETAIGGMLGGGASADEGVNWGKWGGFIDGRISTGDKDKTDNEAGFDFDLYGITAGVDYRIRQNFIVGAALGYGQVDSDYQGAGGGLDIDSWNVSAFLTYFTPESFYLDVLATYGSNDYDSTRRIVFTGVSGTVDRTARGSTDGDQYSLGFGTGFDFNRGAWTFGPHLGGYYFNVDVDGFSETGSGGLNVAIDDQDTQSLTLNAGGHISYAINTNWGVLVPNARFDWVHEFEDNRETLSFQFINDPFIGDPGNPSPVITLQTDRPDSNYFIWSAGVSAQFIYGLSGFVNYQAYTGYRDVTIDEYTLGVRWEKTF